MSMLSVFVGLDYHVSSIQVCVMDAAGRVLLNKACENRRDAIESLVRPLGVPCRAAIEACTGSMDLAQELVDHSGWSVDLAHPAYVARMKRQPDKTDFSDARMLADLVRVGYLPRVWLPPAYIRDLRRLISLRNGFACEHRNLKLRLSSLIRDHRLRPPCLPERRAWFAWLRTPGTLPPVSSLIAGQLLDALQASTNRIRQVEAQLDRLTTHDPQIAFLDSLPAVGPVTAWTLAAYIGDVTRFKNGKQLAHYCGLSPANASSGKRMADAGLVDSGNPILRAMLIELAHRLSRTSPRWRAFKQSFKARGKPSCLIAAAIANRFVRALYHPWKQFHQSHPCLAGALPTVPALTPIPVAS